MDQTMKQFRNPPDVPVPGAAYTHQIEIPPGERLLVLSGQVGRRADGSIPPDAAGQLGTAFENLHRNLQAAGMDMNDIVKLTFFIVGEMPASERARVISQWLGEHRPCMTLVFVSALAAPEYKVELDAWASKAEQA